MSLLLDLIDSQNNAKPAPKAIKSTGSLLLDSIDKLPAASPNDGVPPSSLTAVESPVDPVRAAVSRGRNDPRVRPKNVPPPLDDNTDLSIDEIIARNQAIQDSFAPFIEPQLSGRNNAAMRSAPPPPVQLGRDGVNPVSVFNPLPVDNAQIVRDEISKIEQQPMATQERADAGLFNPNRDFGRAVEFGGLRARSDVKNLVADTEEVLRETAPMKMMQTMQNAVLPVVNPIRKFFGAAPLPENANEKASIAAAAAARQDATRLMDQAKAMGYRQMTTDDIDNFGDFLDWAKTSLGSSGEPMLVSLATGGWMSPLLMAGEYNTNLKEIKGLSKEKRLALASSGGLVAGFLENVGLGILVKGMPKELVGKLGGKWFADKVSKHFGGRIAAAVLSGMVAEGLVEGGQEGIGIGLEASVGKNFKQGEVWTRFKEAMAAGAVVGGGIRGGVQTGTETVGGVQSAITPDPLLSDDEKTVAGFIASDLLNPANAQLTEVKAEVEPTGSLLLDAMQGAEEFATPVQAEETAPTPVNINQTTSTQVNNLQQKAAEAARLAQETEDNIKAAEGKALDLDAKRDEEFRADAEQYAKKEREKAEKLTQQAQELQQFYATPEGQRYAAEIEAIQKEADEAGLNVNITARLNTVPRENIDAAIEAARQNLEFNKTATAAKAGNAPPIPNTPVTDPAELLAPLEGRQTRAAEGTFISEDEKQRALEVVNRLNKQLNDMGFELGQSLNVANSTEEARNLRSELIMAIGVYNELQSQRLARDKGHQNFVPEKLSRVEADFKRIFGSAEPAPAPAVEPAPAPAVEPAPAAEQVNPQAQPVIPFARPVVDTDGQQKTVSIATPDNEVTVQAKPVILDAADLKAATGVLQPRDRSLNESAVEVQRRAANLDPARLLDSPTTDNGAPIVARDGTIISGNGRVLSLRAVYEQFPEQAAAYKQAIAQYGTSDANYDNPVLVMMLDQDMSIEQLADFADRSNRSAIATMSATERAQRDAQAMDIGMVNMFQGGSMTAIENQGFVQQFMRGVVSPTEQNQMSRDGRLTKEGVQRMESAILATAYEDTDALAIMLDSTDDNIKAISRAMLDAAPRFAKLKADIAAGEVNSQFDISAKVTEAARKISDLRNRGVKPRDFFAQQDAFNQVDPDVEALIRAFYNEDLTRAKSQRIMADVLKFYTEEAAQKKQGGFFEDTTTPRDVIELARRKADGTEGQGDLLADTEQRPSRSLNESGQQTQRAAPKRSGKTLKELSVDSTQARRQRQAELADAERTSRAEVAGEDVVGSPEDTIRPISDLDNTRQQKPGTLVDKESMRKGSALQRQAFADAGVDPDIAINMPIERQFKILSDMMQRRFGFANVIKTDKASAKEAVDQLLVGYHNLTDLAANLNLPTKAFGLDGTLSFILARNIGAYGVYNPNNRSITLPRRSNSFAHEWFHALDHFLLGRFGNAENTSIPLASAAVRKHGSEAFGPDAPVTLKDSYFALMRAIYKDKATEAAQLQAINEKMTAMEVNAQKSGRDVSQMPTYQKLRAQKQKMLAAIGKSKKVKATEFRQNAEFFADISQSSGAYWASPAEMSARAFEAFAITQLANAGLRTDGMGKSREAYDMTLEQLGITREQLKNPASIADMLAIMDSRLALTFPKDQERVEIFGAFRNLMDAIARETVLGEGQAATEVGNEFVIDIRKMHDVPESQTTGFIADQKREIRATRAFAQKKANQPTEYGDRYKGRSLIFNHIEDSFLAPFFYQKQGQIKVIMKRYPNNRRLKALYGKLATQTGGEFQSVYEGDTLFNAQARQVRMFSDRLKNIINANDVALFNELETNQLHMILTSQDTLGSAPDNVVKAAGGFRTIYNNIHDYANKAGLDLGYAKSGYVPRIPDTLQIAANPTGFQTQAKKVYRVVFDETLGPIDQNSLDYMLDTIKFIQDQRLRTEQVRDDGSVRTLATEPAYIEFTQSKGWLKVRELMADLRALNKQKEAEPDSVTDQQIEALEAKIQDAVNDVAEQFAEFHAEMRESYSDMSAVNWLAAIRRGNVGDPTMSSPQAKFSKTRQLPPEADALMEDFYVNDPVEALTNYILAVTRKSEFERRFGLHTLPDVADKRKYNDAIEYDLTKLQEEGVSQSEVNELKETIDTMLGRNMSGFQAGRAQKLANRFAATLSITLLVRAPIASIAEPFTTALTTGSVQKGIQSFGSTMMEFPGLRKLSKNAAEDIRLRHQFARILGVIDDPEVGDIMTSRIGGEFAGDPNINRLQSKFFAKIKLSGITNAQRRSAAKIGFQYMLEMAYEIRNPSSDRNAARAKLVLKDLGVADSRMDQFIDYILEFGEEQATMLGKTKIKTSALPQAENVMDAQGDYTDMGLQLAVSTMRFVDQTIQDPRTVDRPRWAESGVGRIIYGITSFIYSFQDKVLKAMVRKTKREYGISKSLGKGKAASAKDATMYAASSVAIPMLTLFTAHAIVSTAREFIFNQDRWDREWEEADEDAAKFVGRYLLPLAFARAGLTGAFDPIVQAFTGLKYQRDIANSMLGIGSYVAQNAGDIMQAFTSQNSDNTVASEFKAFRGAYNLFVQPIISIVLASLPLSPTAAIPATGAAMGLTSTTFKNEIINQILELLYGQRYEPGQRGRKSKSKIYTNK